MFVEKLVKSLEDRVEQLEARLFKLENANLAVDVNGGLQSYNGAQVSRTVHFQ